MALDFGGRVPSVERAGAALPRDLGGLRSGHEPSDALHRAHQRATLPRIAPDVLEVPRQVSGAVAAEGDLGAWGLWLGQFWLTRRG